MPNHAHDLLSDSKKCHIQVGNDLVRIIWDNSGLPYCFDTLTTQFQVVKSLSSLTHPPLGDISTFSASVSSPTTPTSGVPPNSSPAAAAATHGAQQQHRENEYIHVTIRLAPGMTEFTPIGNFKLISAENLPLCTSLALTWTGSCPSSSM